MDVQTRRVDGILICSIQGRIDGYGAQRLAEAVTADLYDDDHAVILDLERVQYISSAGIRVFLSLKKDLKGRNGLLALCCVGEYPKKVLDMAGVMPIFSTYATCEEAVSACSRSVELSSTIMTIFLSLSLMRDNAFMPNGFFSDSLTMVSSFLFFIG